MPEPTSERIDQAKREDAPDRDSLGAPIGTFEASTRQRVVIAVCGAVMAGCGAFMTLYPSGNRPLGASLVAWGAVVLFTAFFVLGRQRLLICPGGIERIRGRKEERYRWDEFQEIVSASVRRRLLTYRRCSLVKKDASRIELTELTAVPYEAMVALLRQMAQQHAIAWREEEARG
jgi:hypothetical protein